MLLNVVDHNRRPEAEMYHVPFAEHVGTRIVQWRYYKHLLNQYYVPYTSSSCVVVDCLNYCTVEFTKCTIGLDLVVCITLIRSCDISPLHRAPGAAC